MGYGDISPQNQIECAFVMFIMMTSGILYAYSINEIGNIMNNIKQFKKIF